MRPANDRSKFLAMVLGLVVLAPLGCEEDANPTPSSTFTTGPGATTSGGETGGGGEGGGDGGGCQGEEGCYDCEPTKNEHFLNACTDAQCSPFDNEARLPLYDGPDLPPIP